MVNTSTCSVAALFNEVWTVLRRTRFWNGSGLQKVIGLFYSSHFCSVSESGCCWKSCLINEEAGITHLSVWLFWGADNNTFSAVSLSLTLAHNRSRNVQVFGLKTSWHRLRSWKWKSWYLNLNVQKKKKPSIRKQQNRLIQDQFFIISMLCLVLYYQHFQCHRGAT